MPGRAAAMRQKWSFRALPKWSKAVQLDPRSVRRGGCYRPRAGLVKGGRRAWRSRSLRVVFAGAERPKGLRVLGRDAEPVKL